LLLTISGSKLPKISEKLLLKFSEVLLLNLSGIMLLTANETLRSFSNTISRGGRFDYFFESEFFSEFVIIFKSSCMLHYKKFI